MSSSNQTTNPLSGGQSHHQDGSRSQQAPAQLPSQQPAGSESATDHQVRWLASELRKAQAEIEGLRARLDAVEAGRFPMPGRRDSPMLAAPSQHATAEAEAPRPWAAREPHEGATAAMRPVGAPRPAETPLASLARQRAQPGSLASGPSIQERRSAAGAGALVLRGQSPSPAGGDSLAADADAVFAGILAFCRRHCVRPPRGSAARTAGEEDKLGLGQTLKTRFSRYCHPDTWHTMLKSPTERPLVLARYFAEAFVTGIPFGPGCVRSFPTGADAEALDAIRYAPSARTADAYARQQAAFCAIRASPQFPEWLQAEVQTGAEAWLADVAALLDYNSPDGGYVGPSWAAIVADLEAVLHTAIAFAVDAHCAPGAVQLEATWERFGHLEAFRRGDMACADAALQPFEEWAARPGMEGMLRELRVRVCVAPRVTLQIMRAEGEVQQRLLRLPEVLVYRAGGGDMGDRGRREGVAAQIARSGP